MRVKIAGESTLTSSSKHARVPKLVPSSTTFMEVAVIRSIKVVQTGRIAKNEGQPVFRSPTQPAVGRDKPTHPPSSWTRGNERRREER
jgi:hypothetical protein